MQNSKSLPQSYSAVCREQKGAARKQQPARPIITYWGRRRRSHVDRRRCHGTYRQQHAAGRRGHEHCP